MSDIFGVDPEMWQRFSETERAAIEDAKTKAMRARLIRKATLPRLPKGELYETPADCTEALLRQVHLGLHVWEPAVGRGAISRVLEDARTEVVKTDLHDWGCPGASTGRDFLREQELLAPVIVTNPPFSLAEQFVRHALNLGAGRVCLFLRLAFLEGNARRKGLYTSDPPAWVYVMSKRRTLWRADDPEAKTTGGALAFAWMVWDRFHEGETKLGWME